MSVRIDINRSIVTWAISRAGYSVPEFLQKFPTMRSWILGDKNPTIKQLEAFSNKVYIPYGYLFLEAPPVEKLPIPYFRSNGNQNEAPGVNVYDTILIMQQRQEWLRDYKIEQEFDPLSFVGKFKDINDVPAIVRDMRRVLKLSENWASEYSTWSEAQNHLIDVIEDKGIVVTFNGVVDNNGHRKIPVEDCRGFVLVDDIAPFMFVNNSDFKSAQMFTIVHELAHIWTGQSAGFDFRRLQPADDPIERLCDQVAAEFLVPELAFHEIWNRHLDTSAVAKHFKVSEIVVARRALDTKKWSRQEFFGFYEAYRKREFKKNENRSSGGNFYATARKRLSITFAHHVNHAVKSGALLYRDACKLTSLKGDTFEKFFNQLA